MADNNSNSTAIVAIFALMLLAGAAWFFWIQPSSNTTVIKEKETHTRVEEKDDGPDIKIDLFPDDEKEKDDSEGGSSS